MASAHIEINGTGSRHNVGLRQLVDDLVATRAKATQLKAVFDQTALGGDWQALAGLLDIGSVEEAEAVYNLLGSVVTELNGPFIAQLTGRVG
jgi:hypothetical protein